MTGMLGMDPQSVRQVITSMDNAKSAIDTAINSITSALSSAQWQGTDRTTFESEWQSSARAQLTAIASLLDTNSQNLTRQIQAQETTSQA